jgi:acetyl esterase
MPLDPQAQKVLDATAALGLPPTEQMTPAEARESMRSRTAALGPVEDVARVDDHRVPVDGGTITVRCYTPAGRGPFPAYIYFHGGGWVIGDIETHDGICRSLANASGSVVASVDYRLAPEHKYPCRRRRRVRGDPVGRPRGRASRRRRAAPGRRR